MEINSDENSTDRLEYLFLDNCTLNPVVWQWHGVWRRGLTGPLTPAPDYVNPEMILFSNIKY